MKQQLTEGVMDKLFQGLFKLLFKNQLKQAEGFVDKINEKLSDSERAKLNEKFKAIEEGMKRMQEIIKEG